MVELKIKEGIDDFITSTQRILTVSKKPDSPQYWTMIRVTAVGIAIIGIIGYGAELANFLIRSTFA